MSSHPSPKALRARLRGCTLRDERRLGRRLERVRRRKDPQRRAAGLAELAEEVARAEARLAGREASVPTPTYPDELPVTAAREELLAALGEHRVVVVAGETGSGKTTQLGKLCLELGRGVRGAIAHTQPRRIAARTVAARIAEELDVELGAQVGYQVRFADRTGEDTLLKVMTDGVLLAEAQRDPWLRGYDTVIVDEAHERSLNIDFLLGYLTRLLERRDDLQVVITSATIDPERFSRHFGGAPIVEVSGRTYPVEVRHRPPEALGVDDDQADAVRAAVEELAAEGPGDVLVFLPGERDIREAAAALEEADVDADVLALYARQSPAEQRRVFQPQTRRRVVLATNVAETSLTVPGIRYVVDAGTARISRYSHRTKVQRLPIEPISQASALQRAGRCGRVAAGICVRLYGEEDFAARPAFTDPEIQRTNLASVLLQMAALGLGDVEDFPFVDPPDRRSVRAAAALLHELGAFASPDPAEPRLTEVGRTLARLPVDPRLGRMLVEADRQGCLAEALVIVAALSIPDPRQRPEERRQRADELHARFADERSDFLAYLALWEHVRARRREMSANQFRRLCREEFLHHLRVREWQDLHAQLRDACQEEGMTANAAPADPSAVHAALLPGLLSHVGARQPESRDYLGARGARFRIWPGSALAGRKPAFVAAAELVETSRLWARTVAEVDPAAVERAAGHLVERRHGEPWWDPDRGRAMVEETVTLYGVPLVSGRAVPADRADPAAAHEAFVRGALVEGRWDAEHGFVEANRAVLEEVAALEERTRRRDLLVDDEDLVAFYRERVPGEISSVAGFQAWWREARAERPDLLTLRREDLIRDAGAVEEAAAFPEAWRDGAATLRLSYRFEPGAEDDGVTVEVPLAAAHGVDAEALAWQVPGLRGELVEALLRALPKDLRRQLVPLGETVERVVERLGAPRGRLADALSRAVADVAGVEVPPRTWDLAAVPAHLRPRFRVVDGERVLAEGDDLAALRAELRDEVRRLVAAGSGLERTGERDWAFGALPRVVERVRDGVTVRGFPAVVDEGATAGVRVLLGEDEQRRAMWAGTRRLLLLACPPPGKAADARLDRRVKLALARNRHGGVAELLADCAACAVDALVAEHGGPAWDEEAFGKLRAAVTRGFADELAVVAERVAAILDAAGEAQAGIDDAPRGGEAEASLADAEAHLARLVGPGFVTAAGRGRLADVERYARAVGVRVDKLRRAPQRDRERLARVAEVERAHAEAVRRLGAGAGEEAPELGWLLEELRVALFAEQLGTRQRVSEQRLLRVIADLEASGVS